MIERPIRYGFGRPLIMLAAVPVVATILVIAILTATSAAPSSEAFARDAPSGGVLVVGDSVAHNIAFALDRAGLAVNDRAVYGCSLIAGRIYVQQDAPSTSCGPFRSWVKSQRPQYVLLVTGLFETLDFHRPGGPRIVPGTAAYAAAYTATLQRDIDDLTSTGATLIIPTVPCTNLKFLPKEQLRELAYNPQRQAIENALLRSVANRPENRGRVVTPDLNRFVCPAGSYQHSLGDVAEARPDGMHFVAPAADIVARWLMGQVPGLRRATTSATKASWAEQISDVFNLHNLICQMGRAQPLPASDAGTLVPCFYHPSAGVTRDSELRVFTNAAGERLYERFYRGSRASLLARTPRRAARTCTASTGS